MNNVCRWAMRLYRMVNGYLFERGKSVMDFMVDGSEPTCDNDHDDNSYDEGDNDNDDDDNANMMMMMGMMMLTALNT